MVHRKGSRKAHRKGSRKAHRKGSRKAHRKSHRRSQRGGASCAAQPLFNRAQFSQQGGMAPIADSDAYLIDAASRGPAQTASLDTAFSELQHVIPRQSGGRRHRRSHRRSASRKGRKGRKSHRRAQRGGSMAPYGDSYMLGVDIKNSGSHPQWQEYLPAKGAQA